MTDCPKAKRRCTGSRSTKSDPDTEPEGSWTLEEDGNVKRRNNTSTRR